MGRHKEIDVLVRDLIMTDDIEIKKKVASEIIDIAKSKKIFLSSIHDLYKARGLGKCPGGFTVPAINLRNLTYYLARALFRVALKNNAGAFIFEIAKSEMGYTAQPPIEYTGVILAAAIKEGYSGPVFIQADHCQVNAKMYAVNPQKEIDALKHLIEDAIAAGFFNIDIDSSTTVDLEKKELKEQQRANFEICAELTKFIRGIQPAGVMVSVGGEIGEVGGKNSTAEDLKTFMDGYLETLPKGMEGISKISIQTGTSHGGVVLPDGSIAQVKLDFETLKNLSRYAREQYKMAGAVQHGASTLPPAAFNKFPETDAAEIHLATQFQNMMFDSTLFPKDLRDKMYNWLKKNCTEEMKPGQTEDQFVYKARKKALGPFKKEIMGLPEETKEGIAREIEAKFDFLFKQLKAGDTKKLVDTHIKPVDVKLGLGKATKAVLDGQGDD
ncbi:MAG TPA: class II fructose-bisphosphate aldolase [Candidatus Omnitrophota bacterium]|nr:class II fructose-bisphosphate aldolase [Candidatus Omnitrophota bacterium]HPD84964.1 class II fructose-bisphosphate aldolase [Candidatus Omnitrophota bacterium]HRZ03822.1 class II fructose-bisphosphate aldolase [Candidatus Omnitrophota bacterium]